MALIHANRLSKSFGERTLFSDVTFDVLEKDRIGLIGVNGCGKSTLLRMIAGLEPCDGDGVLALPKGTRTALLDQSPIWNEGDTLFDAVLTASKEWMHIEQELADIAETIRTTVEPSETLIKRQAALQERYQNDGGLTYRARTRATLLGLGFSDEEIAKPVACLSGGQMRKVALAKILMSDADVLLLDEPTNHLDVAALEWLEGFLASCKCAYIVISHDRYFLDHVCARIFEMENGSMTLFRGNYTQYTEHKMDEREYALRRYQNGLREIKRIEGIIEQQRRWNQARNYVTIASKEKQIERLKSALVKPEETPDAVRFKLHADPLTANEVVSCKGLSKSFDGQMVFQGLDLLVLKDERICLLGANGCGKTTLLRILMSRLEPDAGSFKLGPNVHIGFYEQSTTHNTDTRTILESLNAAFPRYDLQVFRNLLGSFLFRGDDVFKRVCDLSGGEYARIQLLRLMLSGSNVLFLDEPTNHLDIPSREALENALAHYGGTMLIVTHDRYLANRIADRIIVMNDDGVRTFDGDWDAYKMFLSESAERSTVREEPPEKNAYVTSKERRSAINRAKGALTRAEKDVSDAEAALAVLEAQSAKPEVASDYAKAAAIYDEMDKARAAVEHAYLQWEEADERHRSLTEGTEQTP